jgi:general stress protein CsbA
MKGFAATQRAEVPDSVHAAWDAVLERWDDQARHDTLVQQVASAEAFAWAAGQYQDVRQRRPHDRIAQRQLERVRRTAEAAMLASATVRESDKRPYRSTTTILVMMVVVLLAGGLYATVMRDTRGSGPRTTPAAPVPRSVHLQGR